MINQNTRVLVTGGSGFIGVNLAEEYLRHGVPFLNVDWNPPLKAAHRAHWQECDIMDYAKLLNIMAAFRPTVVVHLAARTDTDIYDLNGDLSAYVQNTEGTQHVLAAIRATRSVQRAIITSSMFVCKAGYLPKNDFDFSPFTLYGVSKVLTEKYTQESALPCTWTIIRPQTVWGPWSYRYTQALFKVMRMGLYVHPSRRGVQRAYGYVGNVVWQINQILNARHETVHQKVFYVGDRPVDLLHWVDEVSLRLTGKHVRSVPTPLVKTIAYVGDALKRFGLSFPITSTRYNSMVEDYLTPIEETFRVFGEPPASVQQGIDAFVSWYESEFPREQYVERKTIAAFSAAAVK